MIGVRHGGLNGDERFQLFRSLTCCCVVVLFFVFCFFVQRLDLDSHEIEVGTTLATFFPDVFRLTRGYCSAY